MSLNILFALLYVEVLLIFS